MTRTWVPLLMLALAAACTPPTAEPPASLQVAGAPAAPAPLPGGRAAGPPAEPSLPPTPTSPPPPAPAPRPSPVAWLAYGDSLTYYAFLDLAGWAEAFAPAAAPAVRNAGMPGATARTAVIRADDVLAAYPGIDRVGLAFGTNDAFSGAVQPAEFGVRMRVLAARVQADGRRPMLARIPFSPLEGMDDVPAFNAELDRITAELGLVPGPDLYAWFRDHPEQLQADRIHMTPAGDAAIRRLWAEALGGR